MKKSLNKPAHRKLVIKRDAIGSPLTEEERKCYKGIAYEVESFSFKALFSQPWRV